jgi:AcrR family transcriptional regulator
MRDPEQTKNRLIEVASKMMADHGVAGLRVDRVASLAKINKRMIYHYFGDKEGLATKVLEQQLLAITPVLSESEMGVLRYFFNQSGTGASLPASGKSGLAAQKSLPAQQRTAVILIRGLLDRWHLFRALEDLPIQALLARLNSLAIGQPTIPSQSQANADFTLQVQRKERITLRPTVNPIHPPS